MYPGFIVETGSVDKIFESPKHRYTYLLLRAVCVPGGWRSLCVALTSVQKTMSSDLVFRLHVYEPKKTLAPVGQYCSFGGNGL